MNSILKPCHCGFPGELAGVQHQNIFYSLTCPQCQRSVETFTLEGLAESWNKPAPALQGAQP